MGLPLSPHLECRCAVPVGPSLLSTQPKMKRMDILCASQASTAICMSMEQSSHSSPSTSSSNILLGDRAIDRHNPAIKDPRRTSRALPLLAPCTSQPPPINPKPYHLLQKSKKSGGRNKANNENMCSAKPSVRKHERSSSKSNENYEEIQAEAKVKVGKSRTTPNDDDHKYNSVVAEDIGRRSWAKPGDISDAAFFNETSECHPVTESFPTETNRALALVVDDSAASKPSSASHSERPSNQVVLRVSLHCRGCVGKVRKHLARMEGVTSFNIDLAAKKVTIVGDVTPSGVLASVSKVKNAQFWTAVQASDPCNLL